jgi:hypothetical protein
LKEGFYLNKDLYLENVEELVDCVVGTVEYDEDAFVTVVAKFDDAKEILKNVMLYEDVNFDFLEIESPIVDNYYAEYVLSFWMNDGILEIGCEKLMDEEGEYTNPCGDIVFLFSNCSSKIIPLCEGSELYFVNLDDECDCDDDCCECCECDCCCGDDLEKVSYQINGRHVSEEEFIKKYKETHNGFMDDFNTLFARLW